jgi:putative methionine-R-sulfoxide reductase with GAF domain
VDESNLLAEISRVLESNNGREEKAARVAEVIRRACDYRWVGVYEVIARGLSGAAVASGETVVAGDVAEDPRYLTAFGSTQSEIIVPVVDGAKRKVVGTIDVESEEKDAFSEADRAALERCAVGVAGLFKT